jgi:DNA mismatch repair protein MutS
MTALEETLKGVKNYNVDVSEENGNVVFLHKIVEGPASRSYGIHVAKLAGVPMELLQNARERLEMLEAAGYKMKKACCVDMFPGTYHVETVCLLTRRDK